MRFEFFAEVDAPSSDDWEVELEGCVETLMGDIQSGAELQSTSITHLLRTR
jgi:hypothetical protein